MNVIKITKTEAEIFRNQMPHMHIAIVNRGKPYKKYYIEENKSTLNLLAKVRDDESLLPKEMRKKNTQQKQAKNWR